MGFVDVECVCVKARGVWLDIQLVDGVDLDVRWRGVDTHVIYSLDVVNKGSRFTRLILLIYRDRREAVYLNSPTYHRPLPPGDTWRNTMRRGRKRKCEATMVESDKCLKLKVGGWCS